MSVYVHVVGGGWYPSRPVKYICSLDAVVTGDCKLSNMGAGMQILVPMPTSEIAPAMNENSPTITP